MRSNEAALAAELQGSSRCHDDEAARGKLGITKRSVEAFVRQGRLVRWSATAF